MKVVLKFISRAFKYSLEKYVYSYAHNSERTDKEQLFLFVCLYADGYSLDPPPPPHVFCSYAHSRKRNDKGQLFLFVCFPDGHRLVGLKVKASASRAEDPGFESRLRQWLKKWHSSGYSARRLAL